MIIDWGVEDGLHVFLCGCWLGRGSEFVRFAADEKASTTLRLLAECFELLGGVPATVLADRMGCLKAGVVADVVVPTPDYVRFATYYGFRPDFCEAADPESKGMVEHLVGYAKRDLMVPRQPFGDLDGANAAAAEWCAEVNASQHAEIAAVPADRLETERAAVAAVAVAAARDRIPARKVDKLSCVPQFGSARYSVPCRLIGQTVTITTTAAMIMVVEPVTGEVLAEHVLVEPGETSILDDHYDRPRPEPAEEGAAAQNPNRERLLRPRDRRRGVLGRRRRGRGVQARRGAGRHRRLKASGEPALLAALQRAITYRRWRAADVRSILAAGGNAPTSRPAGAFPCGGTDPAAGADPVLGRLQDHR